MKTGWIRQSSNTKRFVMFGGIENKIVKNAFVFRTRKEARESMVIFKLSIDIVRKVELNEDGTAKKIIKGR